MDYSPLILPLCTAIVIASVLWLFRPQRPHLMTST